MMDKTYISWTNRQFQLSFCQKGYLMAVSLNRPGVVPSLSLKTRIKECCDPNPTLSAIAMLNFQTQII